MSPEQVRAAAAQQTLRLKAGNARVRLDSDGMEMIRETARRLTATGEY